MVKIGKLIIVKAHHRRGHWRRLGKNSQKEAEKKMRQGRQYKSVEGTW